MSEIIRTAPTAVAPTAVAPTAVAPTQGFWPVLGKAWVNTDKKGRPLISLSFGNYREPFSEVVIKTGDRMMLRPNNKRPDKKDADYQICLVPGAIAVA